MAKVRVHNLAVSLDGFAAGPHQSTDDPLGVGGERLHDWMFRTRFGREMMGQPGGDEGLDQDFLVAGVENVGATIMGRNMFGPERGEWGESDWKGWWGPSPPYQHPVFVLTHHARAPIPMDGGTTFHFVTEGIEAALEQAVEAAEGRDVRLAGGAATIRQYLDAGLVDEMHVAVAPVLLGGGERLLDGPLSGYEVIEFVSSPSAAHYRLARRAGR